ncbi:putative bifunctional diguanylate cyclase/phosphodiesterase [Virgisporangium aurantiacum]|uniref:putative bifunctional diguanylate cyclase/phosphodiesterase n=1 Tax=Virgisporangium aurantiacum TaxID=175570 RepID=UPI001EF2D9DB|nr:bifunctional diguanylate cyclase/phosphodiesterase [Virgisporangium aurantiacum]
MWLGWLLCGITSVAVYLQLPDGLTASVLYEVIGAASAVGILVGVRLNRPARPWIWYWFAAGQGTWVVGDIIWTYYVYGLHEEPYPSVADAFYLSAYPMLLAGLVLLVRHRSGRGTGRDVASLVDAAIVATGLGLVFWVLVIRPIAEDTSTSMAERLIGWSYPAADVVILVMLLRAFAGSGIRTAAFRLLGWAGTLLLGSDVGYSVMSLHSSYEGGLLDAGWLLSYVLWTTAALHPSMSRIAGGGPADATAVGPGRLVLLAASLLLTPGLLFIQGALGTKVDWLAIGTAAVVLFGLLLVRLGGFVRQVRCQSDELSRLAMHDDLTGLANRRLLEKRLGIAAHQGVQLALIDLDGFKTVNDRLGHPVGDQLLAVVGQRLNALVRPTDTVARMGGDEFAVLMPGADAATADRVVDRVAEALQEPVSVAGNDLLVGASIGVADSTGGTDPAEIMRRADVAMYAAKERRGRALRYRPDLDERAAEDARLGAQLRIALDTGQLRLVYQPIVELPEGRTVAVETLVRWDHPELGEVGPATFIPFTERSGLIVELGAWVLRTACAQAQLWRTTLGGHAPQRISVNVSPRQLTEPGFADMVIATLAETGLPAGCLAVEVTETAVFTGGKAIDALHDLHRHGVRIALDDFGTGYSSLGLLQTVPVDILKVDKSFVDGIAVAGRESVIARALIGVSTGLGLTAVAEGVETAEQANELYRMGYRYAQGYYFGRPTAEPVFQVPVHAAA